MKLPVRLPAAFVCAAAAHGARAPHRRDAGAGAEKSGYPHVDAEIEIELQPQWSYRASYGPARAWRVDGEAEASFAFHLSPGWSVNTVAKLERVALSERRTSVLGSYGAFLEELNFVHEGGDWNVRARKWRLNGFG
jgi:hypothetical protein